MLTKPLLSPILENDALTRGLGDPEARILVEWLVEQAESLADHSSETAAAEMIARLCHHGRAISRFVALWCHFHSSGAAIQLAATERFTWPLPLPGADPCELMQTIVLWETDNLKI